MRRLKSKFLAILREERRGEENRGPLLPVRDGMFLGFALTS